MVLTTWNIYTFEGRHLGQHRAIRPEGALYQYMAESCDDFSIRELTRKREAQSGSYLLEFRQELFVVRPVYAVPQRGGEIQDLMQRLLPPPVQ